ncbi:Hypothetical protein NocV09_01500060 [Nannochloropsis oceanica]
MGSRAFLGLCALLLACMVYATDPPVWPDIDFVSFKSNRASQRKGKSIRFTGIFRVNNFGLNDITYCGFKNENSSIITTSTGAAGIRFKQQNTLFKAKWYIKEVRSMGRIVWEFTPNGYALTQGRTYTTRMVVRVAKDTPQDAYTWRFFCESKYTNSSDFTYPGHYAFGKIYKTIPLLPAKN